MSNIIQSKNKFYRIPLWLDFTWSLQYEKNENIFSCYRGDE